MVRQHGISSTKRGNSSIVHGVWKRGFGTAATQPRRERGENPHDPGRRTVTTYAVHDVKRANAIAHGTAQTGKKDREHSDESGDRFCGEKHDFGSQSIRHCSSAHAA
ncbi:uncharacterized protein PV09_07857 [Verruconis gallopava]|uniref:Uncharacterized protein n=1 Tax=Verruconis gallopava TaxID=253628 RepID=A0A0D2A1R1_9PEZI|nr:uncharacterized protein PV09_07857 [Verruconis gallopava]KIW00673.1 hypothetical protein PV09_07857 [Verruconis gallopava]